MSILASRFISPPKDSHEYKALAKALDENPRVVPIGNVDGVRYYQVNSTRELDVTYPVRVWEDQDFDYIDQFDIVEHKGLLVLEKIATLKHENPQSWVECFCPAATPLFDPAMRNLICWLPKVCYHMAAVVLYEAWYDLKK